MAHAAVTDLKTGRHVFSPVVYRETKVLGEFNPPGKNPIAWTRGPDGSNGKWRLDWNGNGFDFETSDPERKLAFKLSTAPRKTLVFEGPNGLSQKDDTGESASEVYSFTRLVKTGTLTMDGQSFGVVGESWMDKEFASHQPSKDEAGSDLFSLQFDDGRELILYALRGPGNKIDYARGTMISKNASFSSGVRTLSPALWDLTATARWTSPDSGAEYPSEWVLDLPSEHIYCRIDPVAKDQENRGKAPGLPCYAGAVRMHDANGRFIGHGFVELTGYGPALQTRR
jgi:predicted secreted hydrolase